MTGPDHRFGRPFDLLLLCGAQTESGRSLHDITDVAPVVAEGLLVLGETPLREAAMGLANNCFRRLEELTPQGEPTAWGSLGIVSWVFSGVEVAGYFGHAGAASMLEAWLRKPKTAELESRLSAAGHSNHMGDLDELMGFVQEEDGRPRLGDYSKEVVRSLRGIKVRVKTLPDNLHTFEEAFEARIQSAVAAARASAASAVTGYVQAVEGEARGVTDRCGPGAGLVLAETAVEHVGDLQGTLQRQRDALREQLTEAEGEATKAFHALENAAARSRTGWLRSLRKPLATYLSAAAMAFRLRHAFDLTETVLAALAGGQERLHDLRLGVDTLAKNLTLVRERCRQWTRAFESQAFTPVTEIIRRPLYDVHHLDRLYQETYGARWGTVSAETEVAVRQSLGSLSRWLGQGEQTIYQELIDALLPVFHQTASMTADDFVRWRAGVGDLSPAVLLRDSETLAPVLCRYDRARLPDSGASFEEASFRLIGVPDRDKSISVGIADALLVSTGDPERITLVVVRLGFPASGLWHYPRYQQAYEEVGRQGRVAQRIYPEFPYGGFTRPPAAGQRPNAGPGGGKGGKPRAGRKRGEAGS